MMPIFFVSIKMQQLYAKVDSVHVKQYIKNCRWCQTHKVT